MKSLIKKIARTNIGFKFRNLVNFRPQVMSVENINEPTSVSDAFCWRTDSNYVTTFKFSDILRLFYKIKDSYVELVFFNNNNKEIKRINLKKLEFSNEIILDKKFFNGVEDYGVFYIYHCIKDKINTNFIIANRCYLGFSYRGNINSYVHGNSFVNYKKLEGGFVNSDIVQTTLLPIQRYRIQNYFKNVTKSELFFANPTSKKITFNINNKNYFLKRGCSILIDVTEHNQIDIKSNCMFLRPTIFNYKNEYIDVYHG